MVKTTPRLPLPLLALGGFTLVLALLGVAAPGFAGFFPLLSLWAGLALFYAAVKELELAHVGIGGAQIREYQRVYFLAFQTCEGIFLVTQLGV